MKTKIYLLLLLVLFSCNKIIPENTANKNINNKNIINKVPNSIPEKNIIQEGISCGTISCDVKNYLKEKFGTGTNIEGLVLYQERLSTLLNIYEDHNKLIESKQLKKLTDDLYKQYFGCEGNIYDCSYESRKYPEDELNYIFYIFIPQMVIDEYIIKRDGNFLYAEDITQAIKRKDFDTFEIKNAKIKLYKQKLNDFISNINLDLYERERLIKDNEYFYEKILKPNDGLHDLIMKKSVEPGMILLDWTQEGQLLDITQYTVDSFYKLIEKFGITKDIFVQKINIIYGYNNKNDILDEIKNDIYKKTDEIKKKYDLENKMVYDRYLRYDELYIYNSKNFENTFKKISGEGKEYEYYIDIGKIGSKIMLLFNLGIDNDYYFMPTRLKYYDNNNSFLTTNLYKIYKYADEHKYKPLNNLIY